MEPYPKTDFAYSRNGKLLFQKYRDFFWPTMLATVSTSMSVIVDSIIVGNLLGPNEMASVNLCMPVMQAILTCALLFGMGASILIATSLGRRNTGEANFMFTAAILATSVSGILLSAIAVPSAGTIAGWLTPDGALRPLVTDYLRVLFHGIVFVMIIPVSSYIVRADGAARTASLMLIVSNVVNLLLDLLFIGCLGMGIGGSALATVCGFMVGLGTTVCYLRSKRRGLHFVSLRIATPAGWLGCVGRFVKTGCPGVLSSALVTLKILFINLLVGQSFGNQGLVVFTVCLSCLSFASMFIGGTAGTMVPIVGALYGERDFWGIRSTFRHALRLALAINGVTVLLLECFPGTVLSFFGVVSPEMQATGIPSLRLFAISLMGVTVAFLFLHYYMAIQKRYFANILSVLEGIVLIVPLAWILSGAFGINGIWIAFIVAEPLSLGLAFLIVRGKNGKEACGGFLQLPGQVPEVLYDISLNAIRQDDAARVSEDSMRALSTRKIDKEDMLKTGIALEEIIDNIFRYQGNKGKTVRMDIRITEVAKEIIISLRDNGARFNPLEYLPEEKEFSIDGIILLKKIAKEIAYNQVIGLNQTIIVISKTL